MLQVLYSSSAVISAYFFVLLPPQGSPCGVCKLLMYTKITWMIKSINSLYFYNYNQ